MEELNLAFKCISASEPDKHKVAFLESNFPGQPLRMFKTLEDQLESDDCMLTPHVAVWGTPCDPFSRQRCKRFSDGAMAHVGFDTTFSELKRWLEVFNPAAGVMEQVEGFSMPLHTGTSVTPLSMLLV